MSESLTRNELRYLVRFFVAVQGDVGQPRNLRKLLQGDEGPETYKALSEMGFLEPRDATRSMLTLDGCRYVMALDLDDVKAKAIEEYTEKALEGK